MLAQSFDYCLAGCLRYSATRHHSRLSILAQPVLVRPKLVGFPQPVEVTRRSAKGQTPTSAECRHWRTADGSRRLESVHHGGDSHENTESLDHLSLPYY